MYLHIKIVGHGFLRNWTCTFCKMWESDQISKGNVTKSFQMRKIKLRLLPLSNSSENKIGVYLLIAHLRFVNRETLNLCKASNNKGWRA